jgi:two-component system LytT family response regulator
MSEQRFTTLIVDDEGLARRRLRRMVEKFSEIHLIGEAANGREAVEIIDAQKPDLVFLDVQMPGLSGFDVLRKITFTPVIIFVTAFDEFALQAFEENAIDYLLKPVTEARLRKAIDKLRTLRSIPLESTSPTDLSALLAGLQKPRPKFLERISSRVGERILVFDVKNISHFYAENKYTFLSTRGHNHIVNFTLQELEKLLDPEIFLRIHRSTIVNLSHVAELQPEGGGKYRVRLKGDSETPLIASYGNAQALKAKLGLSEP